MRTYSWVCRPVAGGGEEPPAWPAHPQENQFLPPSWERRSVLWENGCEIGTMGCSHEPTLRGQTTTPKKGLLSQLQTTQVVFNLRLLRHSSTKAGPQDPCIFLLSCFQWNYCPTNAGGSGVTSSALVREAAGPADSVRGQGASNWCAPRVTQQSQVRWDGSSPNEEDRYSPAALLPSGVASA